MPRISRRFLPLLFALACWLLVILVPETRRGLATAWSNRLGATQNEDEDEIAPSSFDPTPDAKALLKRFPNDKRVQIYGAQNDGRALNRLVERQPQDALVLTLALRQRISKLESNRNEGPLTNPNGPFKAPPKASHSPRADWNRFIALTRRGQRLEPNNSYFDWMLLYALYGTRQDEAARAVLAKAARKTAYDDHSRDAIMNHLEVLHLAYGTPLSPRDQMSVWSAVGFGEYGKMRQTTRWVMEGVIADRAAKRHPRALSATFDLVRLGRVMRRESYSLIGSLVGKACEAVALGNVTMPPRNPKLAWRTRLGWPLAAFQSNPTALYFYAQSQNRSDITRFLDAEWIELGRWQKAKWWPISEDWTGNSPAQTVTIIAAERCAALVVKAVPSLVILGVIFGLLSRRFRDETEARGAFWRGATVGTLLLCFALACDALIVMRQNIDAWFEGGWMTYLGEGGLLSSAASWVTVGLACATILLALGAALTGQRRQTGQFLPLKTRLQTLFDAPEDGLMRFDFGWIFGLVAQGTLWLLLLGAIFLFCFNSAREMPDSAFLAGASMGVLFLICLVFQAQAWRARTHRRATLRLGLRLVSQSLCGFFVASSVLYALVAFATLPLAFQHDRNFQSVMQRGELAIARAKLGL